MKQRVIGLLRLFRICIFILILLPIRGLLQIFGSKKLNERFVDHYNLQNDNVISINHNVFNLLNVIVLVLQKIKYCLWNEVMKDEMYPNHKIYKVDPIKNNYKLVDLYSIIDPNVYTIVLFGSFS
eukprot:51550_1